MNDYVERKKAELVEYFDYDLNEMFEVIQLESGKYVVCEKTPDSAFSSEPSLFKDWIPRSKEFSSFEEAYEYYEYLIENS